MHFLFSTVIFIDQNVMSYGELNIRRIFDLIYLIKYIEVIRCVVHYFCFLL